MLRRRGERRASIAAAVATAAFFPSTLATAVASASFSAAAAASAVAAASLSSSPFSAAALAVTRATSFAAALAAALAAACVPAVPLGMRRYDHQRVQLTLLADAADAGGRGAGRPVRLRPQHQRQHVVLQLPADVRWLWRK